MIERNLAVISNRTRRGNLALRNDLRNSFRLERVLEKNSLALKRKLVEERNRTLKGLALRSKQGEKDKKGGVGALGLLGGGLLGRKIVGRRIPKIPKLPTRGGASLSRIGKVGRFGRIGPLAVLGTGLDFAGRKAEGQTNLQAGLGAGGGLAGALAGGKAGAILGTAIGGPVGTLVGGIGGSIIGGLAGGRLADIFSGADRRRKFEERRVEISTQKSLFSGALDDLDRVLDKLEETSIFSKDKKQDDGLPERRFPFGSFIPKRFTPKPETPFFQQPAVQITGFGLLLLGAIALGGITGEESIPAAGLLKAMSKTKMGSAIIKKIPALNKAFKKIDILQPGKDIPGISAKGIQIRAEAILRSMGTFLKKETKKIKPKKIDREKYFEQLTKEIDRLSKKLKEITNSKTLDEAEKKVRTKRLLDSIFEKNQERMNINPKTKIFSKPPETIRGGPQTLGFNSEGGTGSDLGPPNNDFIALAPTNNIFIINQNNSQKSSPPQTQSGDTIVIGGNSANPYDAAINIAQMEALQTV